MRSIILLLTFAFVLSACSKTEEKAGEEAGTATTTVSSEVIGGSMGYIVENARIANDSETAEFTIKGTLKLSSGTSQVMIIRTESENGGFTELLALQFPKFVPESKVEYLAGDGRGAFWVFGVSGDKEVMRNTGSVEGSIRFVKMEAAENSLGLSRDVENGVGEIEVLVTGIDNSGIPVQTEKKYAARFRLPMITLDELSRINQPI